MNLESILLVIGAICFLAVVLIAFLAPFVLLGIEIKRKRDIKKRREAFRKIKAGRGINVTMVTKKKEKE